MLYVLQQHPVMADIDDDDDDDDDKAEIFQQLLRARQFRPWAPVTPPLEIVVSECADSQ